MGPFLNAPFQLGVPFLQFFLRGKEFKRFVFERTGHPKKLLGQRSKLIIGGGDLGHIKISFPHFFHRLLKRSHASHNRLADENPECQRNHDDQDQHLKNFAAHLLGSRVGLLRRLLNKDPPVELADRGERREKPVLTLVGKFDGAGIVFFRSQGRGADFRRRFTAEQRVHIGMGHQMLLLHIHNVDVPPFVDDEILNKRTQIDEIDHPDQDADGAGGNAFDGNGQRHLRVAFRRARDGTDVIAQRLDEL